MNARTSRREHWPRSDEFRAGKIARLFTAAHVISRAWVLIEANRSTKTWSEQVEKMIDTGFDLRTIRQEVQAGMWSDDAPFRAKSVEVAGEIENMASYIDWVSDDFRERKKVLSEMQVHAEATGLRAAERERRQDAVWAEMCTLPSVLDFRDASAQAKRGTRTLPLSPAAARRFRWQRFQAAQERALKLMTDAVLGPGRELPGVADAAFSEIDAPQDNADAATTPVADAVPTHAPSSPEAIADRSSSGARLRWTGRPRRAKPDRSRGAGKAAPGRGTDGEA